MLSDVKSEQRSSMWSSYILAVLNNPERYALASSARYAAHPSPDCAYSLLLTRHLMGILLCVFVRRRCLPHVSELQGATAAVGRTGRRTRR